MRGCVVAVVAVVGGGLLSPPGVFPCWTMQQHVHPPCCSIDAHAPARGSPPMTIMTSGLSAPLGALVEGAASSGRDCSGAAAALIPGHSTIWRDVTLLPLSSLTKRVWRIDTAVVALRASSLNTSRAETNSGGARHLPADLFGCTIPFACDA